MKLLYLSCCLVLAAESFSSGQTIIDSLSARKDALPFASVSAHAGVTALMGDLNTPQAGGTFGADLNVRILRAVSLGFTFDVGNLQAKQGSFYNAYAKANFVQTGLTAGFSLTQLFSKRPVNTDVTASIGVGMLFFDATAYSLTTNAVLRQTNTAGSHRTESDGVTPKGAADIKGTHEMVMPLGIRVSRSIRSKLRLFADLHYNYVYTTKLDATVSGDNTSMLQPGAGTINGNQYKTKPNDRWMGLSVGLTYWLER